ncbi:MAG: Hsp33 family molecular chaperone HslO [Ruminococcaceae bacterium]|nr:Hsp33 family molecular chaperone HslO [Oscillospiraceae bacterium]
MSDTILRGVSNDGKIRIFAAETTELVNRAREIHQSYPIATAALGRLLSAAAMMGSMLKGENDSITLRIKGDGPLGGVLAVGNSKGEVKGYSVNPLVMLPDKTPGKLNVGGAIGKGTLAVICDLGMKEPYVAQIELVSGEIAEDLTAYYAISEQVPSAIALGVLVDTDGSVIKAGGFILQLMPDATDEDAAKLEKTVSSLPPITTMLSQNMTCEDIIFKVTEGFDMLVYNNKIMPKYNCDCTRERVERALVSMGTEEMQKLIDEQGSANLTCQFCDKVYDFSREELCELLKSCK